MAEFFLTILFISWLSSILATLMGSIVYMGRLSNVAASLTHTVLGGVGLATWLGFSLWLGAGSAALIVSLILTFIAVYGAEKLDMVSNILWGGGMSLGILFTSFAPGYQQNLSNFLFGNIILVSSRDVWIVLWIMLFCVAVFVIFFRQLMLLWFSPIFARVQQLNRFLLWFLSLMMVSLGVVCLVKTMGIALVLVLITVPGHIARMYIASFRWMLLASFCITFCSIIMGLYISYFFELPAGASIAVLCLGFYVLPLIFHQRVS